MFAKQCNEITELYDAHEKSVSNMTIKTTKCSMKD